MPRNERIIGGDYLNPGEDLWGLKSKLDKAESQAGQ
jgi:hypothetical protein